MINTKQLLTIIIILGIIGLFTSTYLVKNHYAPGSACDISKSISCSTVNNSKYAELFNVPVAVLGLIWFILLLAMAWKTYHGQHHLSKIMLWWLIIGIIFVAYMVLAEFLLGVICPSCTIVHLIVLISLFLCYLLYKYQEVKPQPHEFHGSVKKWFKNAVLIYLTVIILFNLIPQNINNEALAKCLTEKGYVEYSSYVCGACLKQKEVFGDAYQYISHIECHPQGPSSQAALCEKKGIDQTPTWTQEINGTEIKRHTGMMTAQQLQDWSGCS